MLFPHDERFIHVARPAWRGAGPVPPGCPVAPAVPAAGGNGAEIEALALVVVEMDKVAQRYNAECGEVREDESLALLYLLAKGYRDAGESEAIMEEFLDLREFGERYGLAVGDPELKRAYDRYCYAILEENSIRDEARREGLAAGRAEMAASMRELGIDEDLIRRALVNASARD